jgi:aminopeptidase
VYQPPQEIIRKYADVLVNFALNGGEGVRAGEVVLCIVNLEALPMYEALLEAILKASAHPLMMLAPYQFDRTLFELASPEQLTFFAAKYWRGVIDEADHYISILPRDAGPHALEGIAAEKIQAYAVAQSLRRQWMTVKEMDGAFTWTLGLWGTADYAAEAGMSLEEYWEQIIRACYLDQPDPVAAWRASFAENTRVRAVLNAMPIDRLHVTGPDVDLWVTLGRRRRWVGGSGRNIPSFEIFVSPDWRGTEGYISFNQPLYYHGTRIDGIRLEFRAGVVVKANAQTNEAALHAMLAVSNADKLGEFSLTDGRYSHITRPMAITLFDENMGGPNGNMHVAVGMSYADALDGDPKTLTPGDWAELGFNDLSCAVHTDIITTSPRTVTATLTSGEPVVIYQDGQFAI